MTEVEIKKGRFGLIGWLGAALVVAAIGAFMFCGCADKKTTREILKLLPAVEKPPVECPKHQCRHGQNCEPCHQGEDGDD